MGSACRCHGAGHDLSSSLIRTMTVGSGLEPDLLTLHGFDPRDKDGAGARGLGVMDYTLPPVGNFTPP
ncbi:hypothetical protein GCM10007907_11850 [Chitinimonas prasina]|uniref:Uncharacterized protein n=1 Tax=Chitinimonas prasina TaxID=1434937 RepID=A0ABQ5YBS7_9NEIS|nr:hypothetical protein GCM10007907_11850 [Chitinimonas prasina]